MDFAKGCLLAFSSIVVAMMIVLALVVTGSRKQHDRDIQEAAKCPTTFGYCGCFPPIK